MSTIVSNEFKSKNSKDLSKFALNIISSINLNLSFSGCSLIFIESDDFSINAIILSNAIPINLLCVSIILIISFLDLLKLFNICLKHFTIFKYSIFNVLKYIKYSSEFSSFFFSIFLKRYDKYLKMELINKSELSYFLE